ncbi:lipase member H-A-like [Ostrinia nubilalis]|uniref:lipase member H-A-like n=1 Tax=Ostrinia nubilalis TaxID=29057 RepID=UPI0030822CF7
MARLGLLLLAFGLAAVNALPALDLVISKLDEEGPRYQHIADGDGNLHLADTWVTARDVAVNRFDPERQIVYHLFTRGNPTVSQPLLMGSEGLLGLTNYNPGRRTIILLHGWRVGATAAMNTLLVPAFLSAEDVNVIVVDWSAGSGNINYAIAVTNTLIAAESIARFINWLNQATGAVPGHYHIVGHSLGAHQAGMIGRNVNGDIAYITALEAALLGFLTNDDKFRETDGAYTEVIHTSSGLVGFATPLGHVDFYPNGGIDMPGCDSPDCDHARSYYYMAESLTTGGFTGRRCLTLTAALTGNCIMPGTLRMGGLVPKTGTTGIFHLETNAAPPFSRG